MAPLRTGGTPEESDELRRLERLHCLRVMEEGPDQALDALARVAAELLRTPIALISLITESRQWWKGMYGVEGALARARGTPRDVSFCTHAVAARSPLVVSDARVHPVFADNPLVRDGVLAAYAGVPIDVPGVGALGTLCVLDRKSRVFTAADLAMLGLLAQRVAAEIEWRERGRLGERPVGTFHYVSMLDERHGIYNAKAFRSFADVLARQALERRGRFALVALERAPHQRWPQPEDEAEVSLLLAALRAAAGEQAILGRLDDRALAAALPGAGEDEARGCLRHALAQEATGRAEHGTDLDAPVGAVASSEGAFRADRALTELRRSLDGALLRCQGLRPGIVPALGVRPMRSAPGRH
ncbi:MAG: GAF domain-containing protein [Myxococcales bacterium]